MAKVDFNKTILVGNLTKDPEGGLTSKGTQFLNFSIANNQKLGVNFFDICAFGVLAEICGKYLRKGKQVLVEGKLRHRKFKTKEGGMRYGVDVVADSVQFLGSSNQDRDFNNDNNSYKEGRNSEEKDIFDDYPIDEEIPF